MWRTACVLGLAAFGAAGQARAEVQMNGHVYTLYAARLRTVDCGQTPSCGVPLAEERFQLKASGATESAVASSFLATVDFVADQVDHTARIEPREIYADFTWRRLTVRGGRQAITWGIGDYLFVNDVFPKNYESFFLGRPTEYLKEPASALRVLLPHLDLVFFPTFAPDVTPSPLRFAYFDPLPPNVPRTISRPRATYANLEWAVRLSRTLARWDVALYGYRGFSRSPAFDSQSPPPPEMATALFFRYPRLNTGGVSVEGPVLGGLLGLEGAYYDSEDDRSGTNPFVDNSEVRALAAYAHPLWEDASLGFQVLSQTMMSYDAYVANSPAGYRVAERVRWTATARFTQLLVHQLLQASVFSFVGLTEHDAYLIPSIRYSITDGLAGDVVANIFLGDNDTSYGRFRANTNVRVGLQYGF